VQINLELQRLNNVDGLTGLTNKRCVLEFIESEWRRAAREQAPLSVLMIDVDNFKLYNDTYGHVMGDEALKRIATTIEHCTKRPGDLAARFGGEEFAVVLPDTSTGGARLQAERIRHEVAALQLAHSASATSQHVSVSIGVACASPTGATQALTLIEAADLALYAAKREGKNRVAVATAMQ